MNDERSVLLIHGWPGISADYRLVRNFLNKNVRVIAPDLTGFGEAFQGPVEKDEASANVHADRLLELIRLNNLKSPVVAGYDIGSRIAQAMALKAPDDIRGLVITPGYPGIGDRAFAIELQPHFWYQHFHRLDIAGDALDGNRPALESYIKHFLSSWSYDIDLTSGKHFEKLIDYYARPDAFKASIAWYRANKGYIGNRKIVVPTSMLWPENDPLFSLEWTDKLPDYFSNFTLNLVPDCGHFVPLEAPEVFAKAILSHF